MAIIDDCERKTFLLLADSCIDTPGVKAGSLGWKVSGYSNGHKFHEYMIEYCNKYGTFVMQCLNFF